jgi:hypothetical protein
MHKFLSFFFFLPLILQAQDLIPAEGAALNYTQILFQTPAVDKAAYYVFTVAPEDGNLATPAFTQADPTHVTVMKGFEFGKAYQWRVKAMDAQNILLFESEVHHFSIQRTLAIDPNEYRFAIQQWEQERVEDGVIFLDYCGVAIDRSGKPLWFLPNVIRNLRQERLRDLKMTEAGTLTFVTNRMAVDLDVQGKILWQTPGDGKISGDSLEFYHHEFTRLHSGNYIVLCNGFDNRPLDLEDRHIDRIPLSYLVEYTPEGDTAWTWHTGKYVQDEDYLSIGSKVFNGNSFGHPNSAYKDEEKGLYYIGFRDLSAVLVIDEKTRKVLHSYGDKIPSDRGTYGIGFFQKQHAAVPFGDNEIVLFNNNLVGETSSVLVFNEPTPAQPECKIQWEFKCDFDSLRPGSSDRLGNVQVMNENQFLVNMGNVARLFEVNRQNEILWDCLPERWNADSARWEPFANYRLHFRKSLYPCYFSQALKRDKAYNPVLHLHNEGSESDSYTLEFSTPGKKPKQHYAMEMSLEADKGEDIALQQILSKRMLARPVQVRITSKNNPALVQEQTYNLR